MALPVDCRLWDQKLLDTTSFYLEECANFTGIWEARLHVVAACSFRSIYDPNGGGMEWHRVSGKGAGCGPDAHTRIPYCRGL